MTDNPLVVPIADALKPYLSITAGDETAAAAALAAIGPGSEAWERMVRDAIRAALDFQAAQGWDVFHPNIDRRDLDALFAAALRAALGFGE